MVSSVWNITLDMLLWQLASCSVTMTEDPNINRFGGQTLNMLEVGTMEGCQRRARNEHNERMPDGGLAMNTTEGCQRRACNEHNGRMLKEGSQ